MMRPAGGIDGNHFVDAVTAMQDGDVLARRMDGNVDRKIAENDLPADGRKPPLVRQSHGAAGPLAGDIKGFRIARAFRRRTSRSNDQGKKDQGFHS